MMRRRRVVCRPLGIRHSVTYRTGSNANWRWSTWTLPIPRKVSWTVFWKPFKRDPHSEVETNDVRNGHNGLLEQNEEPN